ncbi:MAG: hypothetical protein R2862_10630 [Thermoanaerobaculia bacterium]
MVDPAVVALGLDPVDFLLVNEKKSSAGTCDEANGRVRLRQGREEHFEAAREISGLLLPAALSESGQCGAESAPGDRLGEEIERGKLESTGSELAEGCNEDDFRHRIDADALDHVDAIASGHADVEEDEIDASSPQALDRVLAVAALADNGHIWLGVGELPKAFTRGGFVVDEKGSDGR